MHPFLDVTKLTDEEIIERLGKAYVHMNNQAILGHTPTVHSIKEVIIALEDERHKRLDKIATDEIKKKYPNMNDAIEIGKLEN